LADAGDEAGEEGFPGSPRIGRFRKGLLHKEERFGRRPRGRKGRAKGQQNRQKDLSFKSSLSFSRGARAF